MKPNAIFFSALGAIVISLIVANQIGNKQDLTYQENYKSYLSAVKAIQEQKGNEAAPVLEELVKKYPERYNLHKNLGLAYAQIGYGAQSIAEYDKALAIRPFLIKSAIFNAQYGEIAYQIKDYPKSKVFFEESLNAGISGELKPYVEQMLTNIDNINKAGDQ
jgi:tetratricopeptide (TPR) repeat protein